MRSIVVDGITRTPDSPLSESFRAALRSGGAIPRTDRVDPRGCQRLSEAICRLLSHRDERPVWLAQGERADLAQAGAARAIEDAMTAQHLLGGELQVLPVTIGMPTADTLAHGAGDLVGEIARAIEREGTREIVERRAVSTEASGAAIDALRAALRGVVHLEELEDLFRAVPVEGRPAPADVDAIWQGFQVRANRVVNDPSPWFISELQRETNQLAAVIDEHHRLAQARISFVEKALDGVFAAAIGAIVGGALFPFTNSLAAVGGALVSGGLTALWRAKGRVSETKTTLDETAPIRTPQMSAPPAPRRDAVDTSDVRNALDDYIQTLREAGLVPVIIWDHLSSRRGDAEDTFKELRQFLTLLPRGVGSLVLAEEGAISARDSDGVARYWVQPNLGEIHAYIKRRVPIPGGLSRSARAAASLDRAVLQLSLVHAASMDLQQIDLMLSDRRVGQLHLLDGAPSDLLALRVRATQQLGVEVILRESRAEMSADPIFERVLPVVLGLPLRQWEQDIPPVVSEALLAQHLHEYLPGYSWSRLSGETRSRLRTAVSKLLGVYTSRAWLVSVLPESVAVFADIVPEWPLLTQRGGLSVWTFRHDGTPRFDPEQSSEMTDAQQGSPDALKHDSDRPSRLRALLERPTEPLPVADDEVNDALRDPVRDYLGDFTPARAEVRSSPVAHAFVDPHPSDADVTGGPMSIMPEDADSAWDTALSAVQLLETLDDVLADLSDDRLSVNHLIRCGLLPSVPTAETIRQALHDETDPRSQCVLAEVSHRIRERIGVIEKFMLWVVAADALTQGEHDIVDIATALVIGRDLRGRPAAEQHARIPARVLKAELRQLCPATRGASAIFKRGPLSTRDVEGLVDWGADLTKRLDVLTYALRDGVADTVLEDVAWSRFAHRLRAIVVDDDEVLAGFAEILASLDRRGAARLTEWLAGAPTCRQLSRLLLAGENAGPAEALLTAKACSAALLGLNAEGLGRVHPGYIDMLDRPLLDVLDDAGPGRRPFVCIVAGAELGRLADGSTPTSGSVFVGETPYDVDVFDRRPDAFIHEDEPRVPDDRNERHLQLPLAETIDDVVDWLRRFI